MRNALEIVGSVIGDCIENSSLDPHIETASRVLGRDASTITESERTLAKHLNMSVALLVRQNLALVADWDADVLSSVLGEEFGFSTKKV